MKYEEGDLLISERNLDYISNPYHMSLVLSTSKVRSANEKYFALSKITDWGFLHNAIHSCHNQGDGANAVSGRGSYLHLEKDIDLIKSTLTDKIKSQIDLMKKNGLAEIESLKKQISLIEANDGMFYNLGSAPRLVERMNDTLKQMSEL